MTQGTKRLTEELHRLERLKLREILDEMAATGSPTVVLEFIGTYGTPVVAVALITGPDTADRIEALQNPNRAAMHRDARRYQWLRDPDNFGPDEGDGPSGWDQLCELAGDDFDAFIDGRMEQDHGAPEDA